MTRVAIVAAAPVRGRLEAIARSVETLRVSASSSSVEALAADPGATSAEVVLLHAGGEIGVRDLDALPPIPVVLLVGSRVPPATIAALLASGARGILPEDASADEIVAALDAAAAGLAVVPPDMLNDLVAPRPTTSERAREFTVTRSHPNPTAPPLTPREREVLSMLAEGLPNKLIASRLGISEHTVKTHLEAVFDKLGASTRAEAVAVGVRRGLLLL